MLRYADRYPRSERVPECFGREAYFDSSCSECRRCHFMDDCKQEIRGRRSSSIPIRRHTEGRRTPSGPSLSMRGPEDRTHAGVVLEGETPFERFVKDCATGACRGFFEEGCDFFRHWRW